MQLTKNDDREQQEDTRSWNTENKLKLELIKAPANCWLYWCTPLLRLMIASRAFEGQMSIEELKLA